MKLRLVALLLLCWLSGQASADFIVSVGNQVTRPSFMAGTMATITVFGRHTETSAIALDGYQLAMDITGIGAPPTPDGNSIPSFFTFFTSDSLVFGNPGTALGPNALLDNFDLLVGGDKAAGPAVIFNVGETKALFNLNFQIDALATPGTYGLFFVANGTVFGGIPINDVAYNASQSYGNGTTSNNGLGNFGQFTVTAVPEPSSMILIGLLAAGGGAIRFVRKRRSAV